MALLASSMVSALWPTRHVAALAYGMQWVVFALHAAPYQSERFYDITGSLTYMACTLTSLLLNAEFNLGPSGRRQQLVSLCLLIWSGRLGYFLFSRIGRDGVDRRFNRMRTRPLLFLVAWNIQVRRCTSESPAQARSASTGWHRARCFLRSASLRASAPPRCGAVGWRSEREPCVCSCCSHSAPYRSRRVGSCAEATRRLR
jgi:hypothetical protein